MKRTIKEFFSYQTAKNPAKIILIFILIFNLFFLLIAGIIVKSLSFPGTEGMGFIQAIFSSFTILLDPGCITSVVEDVGEAGVAIAIVCIVIALIGMITFTGAVIGYVTNYISNFIEESKNGSSKIHASNHIVIINWNSRGSEIINELRLLGTKQKVIVLVGSNKESVKNEIEERISDAVNRDNEIIKKSFANRFFIARKILYLANREKNTVDVVVREGDIFSTKQLKDVSTDRARMVIVLSSEMMTRSSEESATSALTIKTLMQVADITSSEESDDNQKIVVEINDDFTWDIVNKVIEKKQVDAKANITPVYVRRMLGDILSQISLTPELSSVYRELFSNKGATFFSKSVNEVDDHKYICEYLKTHKHAIPLDSMKEKNKEYFYFVAENSCDIENESEVDGLCEVEINADYRPEKKNVVILGYNSELKNILEGFEHFKNEFPQAKIEDLLNIMVITDKEYVKRLSSEKTSFVNFVEAKVDDQNIIKSSLNSFIDKCDGKCSILILSDDEVDNDMIDAAALTNLVYVEGVISKKEKNEIDLVVEIIDPKHYDIIENYEVKNVVISNRYVSKIITQIGEKQSMYNLYYDILSYDFDENESKEIYVKKVKDFFVKIPKKCTADKLIRGVYEESVKNNIPTILLGYKKKGEEVVLFKGDQSLYTVELGEDDQIIEFSDH